MTAKKIALPLAVVICLAATSFLLCEIEKECTEAQATNGPPPPPDVYVDDDADPGWYNTTHVQTIQEGIHNATAGQTIYVYNGTYRENIVVDKTVTLQGENRDATTVDGNGSNDIIQVIADQVTISGFTVQYSGSDWLDAGIKLWGVQDCHVENNTARHNRHAIYLSASSTCHIKNNTLTTNSYYGIYASSSHNTSIRENIITGNAEGGIRLSVSPHTIIRDNSVTSNNHHGVYVYTSDANTITGNTVTNNTQEGIILHASHHTTIEANTVTDNTRGGIRLSSSNHNTIRENTVTRNNHYGIYVYASNSNAITGNTVASNTHYGIYLSFSSTNTIRENTVTNSTRGGIVIQEDIIPFFSGGHNIIYHNNLINNSQNAYDNRDNTWYNVTLQEGNYWDDYRGSDNDDDGIGNQPYDIPGGNNQDLRPLIHPYGTPDQDEQYTLTTSTIPANGGSISLHPANDSYDPGTNITVTASPSPGYAFDHWSGDSNNTTISINITMNSNKSITAHFTTINQSPITSIDTPATGSTVNGIISISGMASHSNGSIENVTIRIDDGAWHPATGTINWTYTWDTTPAANGDHTIYARCHDGTQYSEPAHVTVTVHNIPVNHPPTITITAPSPETPVNHVTFIKGEASDQDRTDTIKKVEIKIGNGTWTKTDGTLKWAYPLDPRTMKNGDYQVQARAYDGTDYSRIASTTITIETQEDTGIAGFEYLHLIAAACIALLLYRRHRI